MYSTFVQLQIVLNQTALTIYNMSRLPQFAHQILLGKTKRISYLWKQSYYQLFQATALDK